MPRRATKIVATLGPASSDPALLEKMIRAGVNVVRLNFSHGTAQDHIDRAGLVREAAQRAGREVAIMADLQGPKIRVGKFAEGKVTLVPGAKFVLDASRTEPGDIKGVGLDYKELPRDVKAGDLLLLNEYYHADTGQGLGAQHQAGWTALIATHGNLLAATKSENTTAQSRSDQAVAAREAVSGVDLDMEAADLLRIQQAYSASAKILQVAKETIDSILQIL